MACLCEERRPGVARHASNFLSRRRKKVTKERATLLRASLRCATGNLRCSDRGCAAELTARYALRSNNCGKSVHEVRVSFGTRTHPLPCASRHAQKGTQRTSIRAIALLGPAVAAHSARAYRAEQRDGPCDCSAPPCGLRLRRGGCGVSMGVGAPMPCALTCRGCPSGARSAKRVPRRTPQAPRRRFTPSHREGVADWGSPFFWVLFFGEAKKSTSPAGATTRLPPSRQAQGQINAQTQTSTSSARTAGGKTNNYQNNSY